MDSFSTSTIKKGIFAKLKQNSAKSAPTKKNSGKQRTLADDCEQVNDYHGRSFKSKYESKEWDTPIRVVTCDRDARPGYDTKKAHEYLDSERTLRAKVKELVKMFKTAKNVVMYTGAGISTASGINDYASKSSKSLSGSKKQLRSVFDAQPTYTHLAITALQRAGLVDYWIQQNHDGLPQKAGFPQHLLNEIHGAWFDPSNPVVPMSGSLRDDLFDDLITWEEKADLVLSMGTSMCGMNSDRVFTTSSQKAAFGDTMGGVIINLQRTQYDYLSSLRIYAKIDDVFKLVLKELECEQVQRNLQKAAPYKLPDTIRKAASTKQGRVFRIPYDPKTGERMVNFKKAMKESVGTKNSTETKDSTETKAKNTSAKNTPAKPKASASATSANVTSETMTLDLREGKTVMITKGMYKGDLGEVLGLDSRGYYRMRFLHHKFQGHKGKKVFVQRSLGSWWIEAALKGEVEIFPIVNVKGKSPRK